MFFFIICMSKVEFVRKIKKKSYRFSSCEVTTVTWLTTWLWADCAAYCAARLRSAEMLRRECRPRGLVGQELAALEIEL